MTNDKQISDLLMRVAAREAEALDALYALAAPRMLGVVMRIVPRQLPAEAVLRHAFQRVCARAGRHAASGLRPMTWLCVVARATALERRKAEARPAAIVATRKRATLRGASVRRSDERVPFPAGAASALAGGERALGVEQTAVLEAIYLDGASVAAVARCFEVEPGLVRARLNAALRTLLDEPADEGASRGTLDAPGRALARDHALGLIVGEAGADANRRVARDDEFMREVNRVHAALEPVLDAVGTRRPSHGIRAAVMRTLAPCGDRAARPEVPPLRAAALIAFGAGLATILGAALPGAAG